MIILSTTSVVRIITGVIAPCYCSIDHIANNVPSGDTKTVQKIHKNSHRYACAQSVRMRESLQANSCPRTH